jgi:excisionase family DNA binding protein
MKARRQAHPGIPRLAYTIHETAAMTGLGVNTVRDLIAKHKIPVVNAGARVIVPLASITKYLEPSAETVVVKERSNAGA